MMLLLRVGGDPEEGGSEILRQVSKVSLQRSLMLTLYGSNNKLCLPPIKLPYLNKLIIFTFPIIHMPLKSEYILLDFPFATLSVAMGNAPAKSCNPWVVCMRSALERGSWAMHCISLVRNCELQTQNIAMIQLC